MVVIKSSQAKALALFATVISSVSGNPTWYPPSGTRNQEPVCRQIQSYLNSFPTKSAPASSFCSRYLAVKTATIPTTTTTTTVVDKVSVKATVTSTTTTTPYSYTKTQTCFQDVDLADPATKHLKRTYNPNWNGWGSGTNYNEKLSSACSCFSFNIAPKTTQVNVKTVTVPTTTVYSATVTATITADTVKTASTKYVPSSGAYVADDGSAFAEYKGYDFYGYDLELGPCGANPNGKPDTIKTKWHGTFECSGFQGCEAFCAAYNDQRDEDGKQDKDDVPCVGVTYHTGNGFCYLKSAVPGNGAPNCSPNANENDNSAILMEQVEA